METNYTLLSLTVQGMKNLEKAISLNFYDSTISSITPGKNKIKAIYGINGSGKTAIILSVYFLKQLMLFPNCINTWRDRLKSIINQKKEAFYAKVVFLVTQPDGKNIIYSYEIQINKINGLYKISFEKISRSSGRTLNEDFVPFIWSENNELHFKDGGTEEEQLIADKAKNTLANTSLIRVVLDISIANNIAKGHIRDILSGVIDTFLFADSLDVFISSEDLPKEDLYFDITNENSFLRKHLDELHSHNLNSSEDINELSETDLLNYKSRMEKLTNFIRIFKPELTSIDVKTELKSESTNKGKIFYCQTFFNYGDYQINYNFESTGIKKLVKLYNYLQEAINGEIVFIDEMDANINDIYLEKLIQFMVEYSKGQLCFTSHSLTPIKVLKTQKHSLDFINEDQYVYSWTNGGRRNPSILYPKGLIPGSPYNFESFNFLSSFDIEEDKKHE